MATNTEQNYVNCWTSEVLIAQHNLPHTVTTCMEILKPKSYHYVEIMTYYTLGDSIHTSV